MLLGHRALSLWYHQLAQQLTVGLPLREALRACAGVGLPAEGAETLARVIDQGGSVDRVFDAAAPWLPPADRIVLAAAAESARLPETLQRLSARHEQLRQVKLRLAIACLYPLAVIHAGLFLLPITRMISWENGLNFDLGNYVAAVALNVTPLWLALGALGWLARQQNPWLGRVARRLPIVGRYVSHQELADLGFVLGHCLEAGMSIERSWRVVRGLATNPEIQRAADAMVTTINQGQPPGLQLSHWSCFPGDFVALYRTGESTGRLDESLLRLANDYQERAGRQLMVATIVFPIVLFLLVALAVAMNVIATYSAYLRNLEKLSS